MSGIDETFPTISFPISDGGAAKLWQVPGMIMMDFGERELWDAHRSMLPGVDDEAGIAFLRAVLADFATGL